MQGEAAARLFILREVLRGAGGWPLVSYIAAYFTQAQAIAM